MNAYDDAIDKEGEVVRDEKGDMEFFSSCQSDSKWLTGANSFP